MTSLWFLECLLAGRPWVFEFGGMVLLPWIFCLQNTDENHE